MNCYAYCAPCPDGDGYFVSIVFGREAADMEAIPVRRELKREQAQSLADALLSAIKREGGKDHAG